MNNSYHNDYVWVSASDVAREFNKNRATIYVWVGSGFIFTLGWKLRRDPHGGVHIGIPRQEYSDWVTNSPVSSE